MDSSQIQPFIGIQAPRIPYIRFEQRATEVRSPSGEISYQDTDFVFITAQGAKDTVEKRVKEWFSQIKKAMKDGNYPPGWLTVFEEMYRVWKETKQDPVVGTPVRNWPAISAAECKILLDAGVRSIEDLAEANEEFLGRIGMGARRLKQLAIDWVTANKNQVPLVAEMDTMRQQIAEMKLHIERLTEANRQMEIRQEIPAARPVEIAPAAERFTPVNTDEGDLIDDSVQETKWLRRTS